MNTFYTRIEEPIRGVVKYLRDNGINTTNSCGHGMTIQCDMVLDGWLQTLHHLLFNYLSEVNGELNYEIVVRVEVCNGKLWRHWVDIRIK